MKLPSDSGLNCDSFRSNIDWKSHWPTNSETNKFQLDSKGTAHRLTYSLLDSGRELVSRSFRIYGILLGKSLFSISRLFFRNDSQTRRFAKDSVGIIRFCLDMIYLDLDLSCDLYLYVTVKGHSSNTEVNFTSLNQDVFGKSPFMI